MPLTQTQSRTQPLAPTSSYEIIPISPPIGHASTSSRNRPKRESQSSRGRNAKSEPNDEDNFDPEPIAGPSNPRSEPVKTERNRRRSSSTAGIIVLEEEAEGAEDVDLSASVTLPRARNFSPPRELKAKMALSVRAYEDKVEVQGGKRKARERDVHAERERSSKMSRSAVTERMINTLGKETNPITNSDLYSRTDHFVSASTGHQQSNRGGGSSGAATYWEVRMAKTADQARGKESDLFKGCLFYINGTTGPRVSNLQTQHLITQNGGNFSPLQSSRCTHIIASGGLSGTKTQKWIDGQAGRGASKRIKVIRIDWLLDCVEKGVRLPETSYSVISDPKNLFTSFGVMPKDVSLIPSKKEPKPE